KAKGRLDRLLGSSGAAALALDIRSGNVIAAGDMDRAGSLLSPPGSTLKPFVLAALMSAGKLPVETSLPCSRRLRIGTDVLDCSHPSIAAPMRIDSAIGYSCNCFVARAAERFGPGQLSRELERFGFSSRTGLVGDREVIGRVQPAMSSNSQQLQALGEEG